MLRVIFGLSFIPSTPCPDPVQSLPEFCHPCFLLPSSFQPHHSSPGSPGHLLTFQEPASNTVASHVHLLEANDYLKPLLSVVLRSAALTSLGSLLERQNWDLLNQQLRFNKIPR